MNIFFVFILGALGQAAISPKLFCVSWMDRKTELQEIAISVDGNPTTLKFSQPPWSYEAQVFEGQINYLTLFYEPLRLASTSRSTMGEVPHLSGALQIDEQKSTLDCDIR